MHLPEADGMPKYMYTKRGTGRILQY